MKNSLVITGTKVVYEAHWVCTEGKMTHYDYFDIGHHEIECRYMSTALQLAIEDFIRSVEIAHDEAEA